MIKKILSISLLGIALAFAQVVDDPNAYTSGAQEPELQVMNVNHTENDEPLFAISIHPISMLVLSLFDVPSLYMTIEGNLSSHLSLVTRPYLIWDDFSYSDENLEIFLFGVSEGLRYYFSEGHRGFYVAPHFSYDRVSLEYSYEYEDGCRNSRNTNVNGFGFGIYIGHKILAGHFTSSWDIGYSYTRFSASKKEKDDVDRVSTVGSGYDINYTIGFAF